MNGHLTDPVPELAPVSAIITAYNSESFLNSAILSVKAQTAMPAEIIVVDDGSTDRTPEIAREHAVQLIRQANSGPSAAKNAGIRAASQPWIAFLDADDLWEPRKIESQMAIAAHDPLISVVTCDYLVFDQHKIITASQLDEKPTYQTLSREKAGAWGSCAPKLEESFSDIIYFLIPSITMVRRSTLLDIGLFDETIRSSHDFDCFMRALIHSKLGIVEFPMARYRIHSANLSHQHTSNWLDRLRTTEKVIAKPHLYPQATVKLCTRWLPGNLRHTASRLLYEGHNSEARALLNRSLKIRLNAKTFAAWAATWLPASVTRQLLRLRYHASKYGI